VPNVVMSVLSSLDRKTGVGHYVASLEETLHRHAGPDERVVFYPAGLTRNAVKFARGLMNRHRPKAAGKVNNSGVAMQPLNATLQSIFSPRKLLKSAYRSAFHVGSKQLGPAVFSRHFNFIRRSNKIDLYHEPNFMPLAVDMPTVITVHDLSVLMHPEWHPVERVRDYERKFYSAVPKARHIITPTEAVRKEVISQLGISPDKVTAVVEGPRSHFKPLPAEVVHASLKQLDLAPGFFLCLGTLEPRKNLKMLMQAYVDLPRGIREKHPLVLAGGWGWRTEDIREYYENVGKPAGVRALGYVDDALLPVLCNGALAMFYPSFYEGFGLPPIEMLNCGGAVVASTAETLVEVLGGQAMLIDPYDVPAWRDAMVALATEPARVQALRANASQFAQRYTWDKAAIGTWEVYRKAVA
jgi:glycosyltransferase involved in cell wall biosynthesis